VTVVPSAPAPRELGGPSAPAPRELGGPSAPAPRELGGYPRLPANVAVDHFVDYPVEKRE
jgi:hypothetical protein